MHNYYAMIMAGGGGTRLWPMSRETTPKQMLPLVEDQSMFRVSVDRLAPLFPPERIFVVTGRKYVEQQQAEAPSIPKENFIIEPYGRDSGPATLLAITVIAKRDPNATIAFLTADHHIREKDGFRNALAAAYQVAQADYITTLGIKPSYPATGFGYIRRSSALKEVNGLQTYVSAGFTEKPDEIKAAQFLHSGEYSWNSGMFIFQAKTALQEFARQQPELAQQFRELSLVVDTPNYERALENMWDNVKRISIDYAIMEGAQQVAVIPVDIGWSDVGSWGSLYEVLQLDALGNGLKGRIDQEPIIIDTQNTLVYNMSGRLVVTIGVHDMVVVDMGDVLMLCHKDNTQEVKQVVNYLRQSNKKDYL